ncbi:MAG: DNA polymerase III subunit gamma/tau [Myxococcota bacterium]
MSYQVIARKWRPQSFDEVSGQGHVTTALRNAIRSGRIPHALLLTGPRGVGKTTLARLIARCLNCEKGPTDAPCGSCVSCREITEGRSTDVQEIDAASRTGVDDMREVIESIRYAAAPGKYRIFVIDEVHMLSSSAFNALLKTLEEPPPRSLFVFATTNPEKIPFTVLSRCQRHDLRRIALSTVSERLAEICASEGIAISPGALAAIAREGDGSMRDAQTLLDQIVAYGGESITDETVADVLDLVDRRVLQAIVEACIEGDARTALEQVAVATAGGSEPRRVADAMLELLRDLVVLRVAPDAEGLFEGPEEERAERIALASRTEPARLRRMFRALVREIEDLSWAPQPKAVLEMAVVRLATLPAGDDVAQLLARLDQLERRLAAGGGPASGGPGAAGGGAARPGHGQSGGGATRPGAAVGGRRGHGAATAKRVLTPTDASGDLGPDPAFDPPEPPAGGARPIPATSDRSGPARDHRSQPPADPASPAPANASAPTRPAAPASGAGAFSGAGAPSGGGAPPEVVFDRLRARALETDRARFASLEGARLLAIEDDTFRLGVPAAFHAERLRDRTGELEALASALFGRNVRIAVEVQPLQTAAQQNTEAREASRRRRQEALNSESVNLAIELLDAEIVEIRPLGENR